MTHINFTSDLLIFEVKSLAFKHPPHFLEDIKTQTSIFSERKDFLFFLPEIDDDNGPENVQVEISNLEEEVGRYDEELK